MQRITRILSKRSFSTAKPDDFTTILTTLSKSPTPLLFRKACYSLSSPSHITQLIQLIKDTPKGLYNPYRDSQILIQSILSTNQHGENDDFLINKVFNSRYFIKDAGLSAKELEIMVNRTAKKCLDNPTDESHLDNLYKLFALHLYYNIPPTAKLYNTLITIGIYLNTPESIRRSTVTAAEQLGLHIPFTVETKCALSLLALNNQEFDKIINLIDMKKAESLVEFSFLLLAYTGLQQIDVGMEVVERLVYSKKLVNKFDERFPRVYDSLNKFEECLVGKNEKYKSEFDSLIRESKWK